MHNIFREGSRVDIMNRDTKEAIKSGLAWGIGAGLITESQVLFSLNGIGHIPFSEVVNGIFPAVAAVGGFVAGYKMTKEWGSDIQESKEENGISLEETFECLEKTGMSNEEQIEYLREQKDMLVGNTENSNDRPKSR